MKMGGQAFDAACLLPQMADAIDDLRGRPQTLPLALVLPVLFYTRKLSPRPASTPAAAENLVGNPAGGRLLFDAGYKCPLTTSRFSWVREPVRPAWQPVLAKGSHGDRFAFNNLVHVKHLALHQLAQSSYFHYFGPGGGRRCSPPASARC
jgi:sn-glycerol 3-phosphate transport system substrate-binding protein